MGNISEPHPVKLFVGMLSADSPLFDAATERLSAILGPIDLQSPVWPWDYTTYYEKEMGMNLKRIFIFFQKLISPDDIADVKIRTNDLEQQYLDENEGRRINLDPGYLDAAKLVLVSTKDFSHRVYLRDGIYGEVTLNYSKEDYRPLPFTYPDYASAESREFFRRARDIYKTQV